MYILSQGDVVMWRKLTEQKYINAQNGKNVLETQWQNSRIWPWSTLKCELQQICTHCFFLALSHHILRLFHPNFIPLSFFSFNFIFKNHGRMPHLLLIFSPIFSQQQCLGIFLNKTSVSGVWDEGYWIQRWFLRFVTKTSSYTHNVYAPFAKAQKKASSIFHHFINNANQREIDW